MNNIIEILGEKKFYNSQNKGLKINFNLEKSGEINFEKNRFYKLSQEDQFNEEKNNSTLFRIYGKINPILNLNFEKNYQQKPTIESLSLDNVDNWELTILRPTKNNKGISGFTLNYDNTSKVIDFRKGLPLLKSTFKLIRGKNRVGLFSFFNHNVNVGDLIFLDSSNNTIETSTYRVLEIDGNYIYIDLEYLEETQTVTTPEKNFKTATNSAVNLNNTLTITSGSTEIIEDINVIEFNPVRLLNSDIYMKKYTNKKLCEYYIKTLTIVDKIEVIDDCAFSTNIYQQKVFTFTHNNVFDVSSFVDNLGRPLTDMYIGFTKKAGGYDYNFSNVVSCFDNLIEYTYVDTGMEIVSKKKATSYDDIPILSTDPIIVNNEVVLVNNQETTINQNNNTIEFDVKTIWEESTTPDINDVMLHSLVEYDSENIEETVLNKINHTFYGNESDLENIIRFSYDPFYKVEIRKFSNSIEESNDNENVPSYAVYNERYQTYRWRELLNIGLFEDDNNGIDLPFLNGMFYAFKDIVFILRNHDSNFYEKNTGSEINTTVNFDYIFDETITEKPFEDYNEEKKCIND
jgi:hypothetical protein